MEHKTPHSTVAFAAMTFIMAVMALSACVAPKTSIEPAEWAKCSSCRSFQEAWSHIRVWEYSAAADLLEPGLVDEKHAERFSSARHLALGLKALEQGLPKISKKHFNQIEDERVLDLFIEQVEKSQKPQEEFTSK